MRPLKKFVFSALLLAFSSAFLLVAAEILLRVQERRQMENLKTAEDKSVRPSDIPGLNYTLAPGHFHDAIVFNRHGFNMPERDAVRRPGTWRILFVGDSVTQGVGITNTAEAFPNRVDALVRERTHGDAYDVWNCGTGGYNAKQILLQMQYILPPLKPDAIVYTFNFNDYWEAYQFFHGQPGLPPERNAAAVNEGMLDLLKKFRVVLKIRDAVNAAIQRIRGYAPVYVDQKIGYPSWRRMKDDIAAMRDHCHAHGIRFAAIIHPNEQFLHKPDPENTAHRDIVAFFAAEEIPALDLLPVLRPHSDEPIYLDDGNHMTPLGYEVIARAVTDWILSRPDLFPAPSTNGSAVP